MDHKTFQSSDIMTLIIDSNIELKCFKHEETIEIFPEIQEGLVTNFQTGTKLIKGTFTTIEPQIFDSIACDFLIVFDYKDQKQSAKFYSASILDLENNKFSFTAKAWKII